MFWPKPEGDQRVHFMGAVLDQMWLSGPWCVDSWRWRWGKAPGNQLVAEGPGGAPYRIKLPLE